MSRVQLLVTDTIHWNSTEQKLFEKEPKTKSAEKPRDAETQKRQFSLESNVLSSPVVLYVGSKGGWAPHIPSTRSEWAQPRAIRAIPCVAAVAGDIMYKVSK